MATILEDFEANVPEDIVANLFLVEDQDYIIQNVGGETINVREMSATPDAAQQAKGGHQIEPGATWAFTVGSDGIWIWGNGTRGTFAVTES